MRQFVPARLTGLGVIVAAAAVIAACSETQTPPPMGLPALLISDNPDVHACDDTDLVRGKFKLIKTGGTGEFEIVVTLEDTGEELDQFNVTLNDGECAVVYENNSDQRADVTRVTVTEISENFESAQLVIVVLRDPPPFLTDPTVSALVNAFKGAVATYKNAPGDDNGDGGAGCTPGFWKQPQHLSLWGPTGLSPEDDFDTTFGTNFFDPDITLLEALGLGGGGLNKVARHGTGAVLNVGHPDVDYAFTAAEVIAAVQAQDVDDLVGANEAGCDIE